MLKPQDIGLTPTTLYRLAQACEAHLKDSDLAASLRTLAAQVESRPYLSRPPSLEEAAALASGLNKFLGAIRRVNPERHDAQITFDLRALLLKTEDALSRGIRQQAARRVAGLYVIVDPQQTAGRDVVEVARATLSGGATAIQYRDKVQAKGRQLPVAHALRDLCDEFHASFIVNDHADLAAASGAHGLHVGQHDLPAPEARRVLYPTQFLGTSNALLEEAQASLAQGVDYIAVGAMFGSPSKEDTRPAGLAGLRRVRKVVSIIPLVAIGGITLNNVDQVLDAGADGVCVISAVCLAPDPELAAKGFVGRIAAHHAALQKGEGKSGSS